MSNDFNIKNIAKLASINLSEEEQESLSNDFGKKDVNNKIVHF